MFNFAGDIKTSFIDGDHFGWYKCDGREIALIPLDEHYKARALYLFPSGYLPNLNQKYLCMDTEKTVGETTEGSNSALIKYTDLPEIRYVYPTNDVQNNLKGVHDHNINIVMNDGEHVHETIISEYDNNPHRHLISTRRLKFLREEILGASADLIRDEGDSQITDTQFSSYGGSHTHNIVFNNDGRHSHVVSTENSLSAHEHMCDFWLNESGSQTAIDVKPSTCFINYFVSLGD